MNAPKAIEEQQIVDIDTILTPFNGDNPAGERCNYEPEYEAAEQELAKLSSIELEEVNWGLVSKNCQKLLEEKTKDLQLCCFLAVSLLKTHSFAGLNEGLQLVDQLQNSFWHDLYPPLKRMRGRAAAINWMNTQLVKMLSEINAVQDDSESLEEIYLTLESINQFATEYIDQNTPNLSELLRLVNNFRSQVQSNETSEKVIQADTPITASETSTTVLPKTVEASQPKESNSNTAANTTDLTEIYQRSRKSLKLLAESLRSRRLSDPQHFYINRAAVWLSVTELPLNTDGKTQLQPPSEQTITTLNNQIEAGENEQVILAVEEILASSPFWFEGHRISALAMEDMGKKYASARTTIISSTHAFLQRFPELAELSFADGTDFVEDNFTQWLASESGAQNGSANQQIASHTVVSSTESAVITEARKFAAKSKLSDALQLLDNELKTALNGKEKFNLRILQAELCNSAERYDMATPILELLDQEQQQREISSWEPELSTLVLQSLLNCYTKILKKKPANLIDLQSKADSVFDRLCQLDPATAFKYKL